MGKEKRKRFSLGFKEEVIRRMQEGERVKLLSMELLVSKSQLFAWKQEGEHRPGGKHYGREKEKVLGETAALEARIRELEVALGRKTMEVDFFRGALRRLAESGPAKAEVGAKPSGLKSAAGWNRKAD